jgi:hydrogenase nickel incorporation protein HypA/HybF
MHELSLATEMVRTIGRILEKEGASEVVRVSVEIGAMSGVERQPFEFCFPIAAEGTPLAGAKLEIEEVPLCLRCAGCQKDSFPDMLMLACPECGSADVTVLGGRDLIIKSLEVR